MEGWIGHSWRTGREVRRFGEESSSVGPSSQAPLQPHSHQEFEVYPVCGLACGIPFQTCFLQSSVLPSFTTDFGRQDPECYVGWLRFSARIGQQAFVSDVQFVEHGSADAGVVTFRLMKSVEYLCFDLGHKLLLEGRNQSFMGLIQPCTPFLVIHCFTYSGHFADRRRFPMRRPVRLWYLTRSLRARAVRRNGRCRCSRARQRRQRHKTPAPPNAATHG